MFEINAQRRSLLARPLAPRAHRPSAPAALKAGLVAAAIALILLQVFAIAIYDESPWRLARMMAALVRGPGALEPDDEFDALLVAIGTLLHFALALLYAFALARLVADAPRRHATLIGLAFGAALYFVNLYGFTALFPWFTPLRTIDTLMVHMLFGVTVAEGYWAFHDSSSR
jgi:hypothetical protein